MIITCNCNRLLLLRQFYIEIHRGLPVAQTVQVTSARSNIVSNSWKVDIGDSFGLAICTDERSNCGVMRVLNTRKQVVFDLVVQAPVQKTQPSTSYIRARQHLLSQE